ncbi:MAG: pilus assembly protein [Rhodospirillales bacterium]|nr:pilus assembly protein [Rhodospirillales bacterium]
MTTRFRSRRPPPDGIATFVRARRGVAALEFALTAPILLFTILGTIAVGLLVLEQAALDHATSDAARLIRTGQVQSASNGASLFQTRLCADVAGLIPCSALQVDVQSASSFAGINAAVSVAANGTMQNTTFAPGTPGQDVLVRAGYAAGPFFASLAPLIGSHSGMLLLSSVAFQNEMY